MPRRIRELKRNHHYIREAKTGLTLEYSLFVLYPQTNDKRHFGIFFIWDSWAKMSDKDVKYIGKSVRDNIKN